MNSKTINKFRQKAIRAIIDQIWEKYDDDNSGELDKDETREFVQDIIGNMDDEQSVFTDEQFDSIFEIFDEDGSGTIDKDEMTNFIEELLNQGNSNMKKKAKNQNVRQMSALAGSMGLGHLNIPKTKIFNNIANDDL